MARSALPYRLRVKKAASPMMKASEQPTTHRVCRLMDTSPMLRLPSENGAVRAPSAPKNTSPRPVRIRCTATEAISRISTLVSAIGW